VDALSEAGRSPANEGVVRVRWCGFIEITFYRPPEVTASLLTGRLSVGPTC
jgi:hypothetical protein